MQSCVAFLVGLTIGLVNIPSSTFAQSTALDAAMQLCRQVKNDVDRLACYDGLGEPEVVRPEPKLESPAPAASTDRGKWHVSEETNPVDDTKTVQVLLLADEGKSRWGDEILFVARCQSNKTEAYIVWHDYLASDGDFRDGDWKRVTIRVGDKPAETQRWGVSTDSQATFAPNWAGDLLKSMASEQRFVAQVTPYNESPVTAVFDTHGMGAALQSLSKTCGWEIN